MQGYDPVMSGQSLKEEVEKELSRKEGTRRSKQEECFRPWKKTRDGKSAKDKGYSLRDWFKGGGWKQTGGKYDGKPCAKQPGQTTKPFCRDADDRANMSKDERTAEPLRSAERTPTPTARVKS